ncbi:hypothetical protein N7470_009185 [Penicillium chermesinum]|nr:hypothetical protein N7470_009185 [Penicillium chermesinum]
MSPSGDNHNSSPQNYQPAVPADLIRGPNQHAMEPQTQPKETRSSSESSAASLKSPRTARFAEATSIHSPIEQPARSPFADPPQTSQGVADTGFGFIQTPGIQDQAPPMSPFRPDLKVPNTARSLNPLSPTFREEYFLEKQEATAKKENARDLVRNIPRPLPHSFILTLSMLQRIKLRVRLAKIFLRFVNFGCSLIVLSMLAVTLRVFQSTVDLPPRNSATAWAPGTTPWTQWLLLGLSCFSLLACLIIFWGYYKGGHKRAEKVAIYYSVISVVYFTFSFVIWIVGAAVYYHSKATGNSKDMWGWTCAQNTREQVYSNVIDYALLCRLQDWGLVCAIIEIVIELIVILIYVVVFYRFYTKRRLMKTMNNRDQARSDLYLAQLHLQSAPNTPGFPGFSSYPPKSPFAATVTTYPVDHYSNAEKGQAPTQYATPVSPTRPTPAFQLQAPPIRVQQATPKTAQEGFVPQAHTPLTTSTTSGGAAHGSCAW